MVQPSRPLSPAGVEDYPYDPAARVDELWGLDRLRAVADRKLAEHLYLLYLHAERNSTRQPAKQRMHAFTLEAIGRVAARALTGDFGPDARELAEYLLLDDNGRQLEDEVSLRAFATGFRKLRNGG